MHHTIRGTSARNIRTNRPPKHPARGAILTTPPRTGTERLINRPRPHRLLKCRRHRPQNRHTARHPRAHNPTQKPIRSLPTNTNSDNLPSRHHFPARVHQGASLPRCRRRNNIAGSNHPRVRRDCCPSCHRNTLGHKGWYHHDCNDERKPQPQARGAPRSNRTNDWATCATRTAWPHTNPSPQPAGSPAPHQVRSTCDRTLQPEARRHANRVKSYLLPMLPTPLSRRRVQGWRCRAQHRQTHNRQPLLPALAMETEQ